MTSIGCSLLVQWYEIKILPEYISSLQKAITNYNGKIILDFCLNINQDLEKIATGNIEEIIGEYQSIIDSSGLLSLNNVTYDFRLNREKPIGIGEFRRESNINLANKCDVIIWGETDSLVPSNAFNYINLLYGYCHDHNNDKWCAFFGTNKMWDASWTPIEHENFRDKIFDPESTKNVWDLCHVVTYDEMEQINDVPVVNIEQIYTIQFNGCQLMLSSELIKSGINIPKSMFFIAEDTALMHILRQQPDVRQYLFANIYGPHNRKHPLKRYNILGEESVNDKSKVGKCRACHDWYLKAAKISNDNLINLFNDNYTPQEWKDIF